MHYLVGLFTKEKEEPMEIYNIMSNIVRDDVFAPFDWCVIGGRFENTLKTKNGYKFLNVKISEIQNKKDLDFYAFLDMYETFYLIEDGALDSKIQFNKLLLENKGYLTIMDCHN